MSSNIESIEALKRKKIKAIDMIKLFIYKYAMVHVILLFLIIIELILSTRGI